MDRKHGHGELVAFLADTIAGEIEIYKAKLRTEFGYSNKDMWCPTSFVVALFNSLYGFGTGPRKYNRLWPNMAQAFDLLFSRYFHCSKGSWMNNSPPTPTNIETDFALMSIL